MAAPGVPRSYARRALYNTDDEIVNCARRSHGWREGESRARPDASPARGAGDQSLVTSDLVRYIVASVRTPTWRTRSLFSICDFRAVPQQHRMTIPDCIKDLEPVRRMRIRHMDGQDSDRLQHEAITRSVLGCAFEVINELGAGFVESVYEKALLVALRQKGLGARCQHPVRVMFRGECVGDFCADIFVEGKVIVELKAVKAIAPEHQAQNYQLSERHRDRSRLAYQLRNPKLEYRRFRRSKDY